MLANYLACNKCFKNYELAFIFYYYFYICSFLFGLKQMCRCKCSIGPWFGPNTWLLVLFRNGWSWTVSFGWFNRSRNRSYASNSKQNLSEIWIEPCETKNPWAIVLYIHTFNGPQGKINVLQCGLASDATVVSQTFLLVLSDSKQNGDAANAAALANEDCPTIDQVLGDERSPATGGLGSTTSRERYPHDRACFLLSAGEFQRTTDGNVRKGRREGDWTPERGGGRGLYWSDNSMLSLEWTWWIMCAVCKNRHMVTQNKLH